MTSLIADLTAAGHEAREAATMADRQVTATFANGRPPCEHDVCHVVRDDCEVGHVWYGPDPAGAEGAWWLYDLEVDDGHRGKGIGTDAVALVEDRVRHLGGTSIALRLFDHNSTARHVYERSGYYPVSTLMRKVL
ncbi:MAG: GNAT family N-acetyltransferase [Ilumatobacteraceae bacterium]